MKAFGLFLIVCLSSGLSFAKPSAIFLIRHGEKSDSGPELSERGWERARALPSLFSKPEFSKYGAPTCLIGMNKKKFDGSIRALQTLKYLSEFFHVNLTDRYNKDQGKEMVQFALTSPQCDGHLLIIAWEHTALEAVAADLGVNPEPKWPGSDIYDRVWVVEFNQEQVTMKDLPQNLLPGDSQN